MWALDSIHEGVTMIEIMYERGRHWPIVRCDACQERITDYHTACVMWDGLADAATVFHAHKGCCVRAIERAIRDVGGSDYWDNLDTPLSRLAYNLGLKSPKDFSHAAAKVKREAIFAV